MPQQRNVIHRLWWVTWSALSCLLVAVLVLWLVSTPTGFDSTDQTNTASKKQFPLQPELFTDTRNIMVELKFSAPSILYAPKEGVLTASQCTPGAEISSGSTPFRINGKLILAFASPIPFWRDLRLNDQGEDVTSLQTALRDLGFTIQAEGVVDWATAHAFSQLIGEPLPPSKSEWVIPVSTLLWLPHATIRSDNCPGIIGSTLNATSPLITTNGALTQAVPSPMPATVYPGGRKIVINGMEFLTDANGGIASSDFPHLAQVLSHMTSGNSASLDTEKAELNGDANAEETTGDSETKKNVQAQFLLADPVTVWPVPVNAVTGAKGDRGCVWDGKQGYPVSLVTSQLGKTLVSFSADTTPPRAIDVSTRSGQPCE